MSETNKPVQRYQAGCVSIAVWENTREVKGKEMTFQTFQLDRNYKDADDKWQKTNQFKLQDLPKVMLACQEAFRTNQLKQQEED